MSSRRKLHCVAWEGNLRAGVGVHLFCHNQFRVRATLWCVVRSRDLEDLSSWTVARTDLALAAGHGDVDETASVSESLLGAALRSLLLLLLLDLRGLRLDLACIAKFVRLVFSSVARSVFVFGAWSRDGSFGIHHRDLLGVFAVFRY